MSKNFLMWICLYLAYLFTVLFFFLMAVGYNRAGLLCLFVASLLVLVTDAHEDSGAKSSKDE
jgi:hypothetical protein